MKRSKFSPGQHEVLHLLKSGKSNAQIDLSLPPKRRKKYTLKKSKKGKTK